LANDAFLLRGDLDLAAAYAERALAEGPVSSGLAFSYGTLAICATANQEFDRAHAILTEGQRAASAVGVPHWQAYFEMLLAGVEGSRGDQPAAQRHAREALRMARESEYPYRLAQALGYLARVLRYDDPAGARRAADEALDVARRTPGTGVGNALMTQADLAAISGSPREAIELMRDATVAWGDVIPSMVLASAAARACRMLADVDESEAAAVLAGVARHGPYSHVVRATIDEPGRADLERTLERLRERLGDDAFESAVARGAAFTSDEILKFLRSSAEEALSG